MDTPTAPEAAGCQGAEPYCRTECSGSVTPQDIWNRQNQGTEIRQNLPAVVGRLHQERQEGVGVWGHFSI